MSDLEKFQRMASNPDVCSAIAVMQSIIKGDLLHIKLNVACYDLDIEITCEKDTPLCNALSEQLAEYGSDVLQEMLMYARGEK